MKAEEHERECPDVVARQRPSAKEPIQQGMTSTRQVGSFFSPAVRPFDLDLKLGEDKGGDQYEKQRRTGDVSIFVVTPHAFSVEPRRSLLVPGNSVNEFVQAIEEHSIVLFLVFGQTPGALVGPFKKRANRFFVESLRVHAP